MMGEFYNILANRGLKTNETLKVTRGKSGDDWQFFYTPENYLWLQVIETEPGLPDGDPESLNVPTIWPQGDPRRLVIEASYKHFRVVFEQANVSLKAGQTYLLKATTTPMLKVTDGSAQDSIRLRAFVRWNGRTYPLAVQPVNAWGAVNENVWCIKANEEMQVNVGFEPWSVWGNMDGQWWLDSLEMLEVPSSYTPALELGEAQPEPKPEPEPQPGGVNLIPWLLGGLILAILLGIGVWIYSNFWFYRGLEVSMPSVITPDQAVQMLLGMLLSILAAGGTSLGATPLTNILKSILALPVLNREVTIGGRRLFNIAKIPARHVAFAVAAGFTVAGWVAYQTSTQPALNQLSDYLVQFAPFLTLLLATLGGQKAFYAASWRAEIPLFGTKRS